MGGTQGLVKGPLPKGQARRSPSETLLTRRTNLQATKGDLNHSPELRMVREQPRASPTSTPTQSLPPTSRPAGAGALCRAGLSDRLVQLSVTLCLTSFSHHALNETETDDYMEDEP